MNFSYETLVRTFFFYQLYNVTQTSQDDLSILP